MLRTLRPFFLSFFCTLVFLVIAAIIYSKQHYPSPWIVSAALPALACEAFFYLASTFKETREWFRKIRIPRLQALLLWVSALLPYLIFALATGTFNRNAFYLLAGLTAALSFWFVVFPRRAAYDIGFLIIAAAPQITRVFARLYIAPSGRASIPIEILGHLSWIHVGVIALLTLREWNPGEFSLWPAARDWQIGSFTFLIAIAPLIGLAEVLRDVHFLLPHAPWWRTVGEAVGVFFGTLWVVALSEELFFRGFIQRALENRFQNPVLAILSSAILFGSAHLWLHAFPNWRHCLVAALLGVACGVAYWRAGSVRASMVTHAFVVTTWRLFFR